MSFIAVRRSLLTSVPRLGRTFAASSFQLKTVTESVKDAAEKVRSFDLLPTSANSDDQVNRVAADAALKGIETTEQVKNQAVDAAAPMMEKAKDVRRLIVEEGRADGDADDERWDERGEEEDEPGGEGYEEGWVSSFLGRKRDELTFVVGTGSRLRRRWRTPRRRSRTRPTRLCAERVWSSV